MKRLFAIGLFALFTLAAMLLAQRAAPGPKAAGPDHLVWEYKSLLPQETSPARYRHVEQFEVAAAASQGWELVAVSPWVYQNEERGPEGRKLVVTQTYQAYFFKRLLPPR
ncbi:MAG: hypothetical protein U0Q16_33440 [Bryobacteraceae bacterium]